MNTKIVVAAISTDTCAAQRRHRYKPTPAATYAKPSRKLNQRTNGTMLPAEAVPAGRAKSVFPPTAMVSRPNPTATMAAATAHRGRRNVSIMASLPFGILRTAAAGPDGSSQRLGMADFGALDCLLLMPSPLQTRTKTTSYRCTWGVTGMATLDPQTIRRA